MKNSAPHQHWTGGVLWRVMVAAALCTAATTAVIVFAAFLIGQSILPASRPGNAGLNAGIAGIAALVALVAGVAGGVLTAIGAGIGWLIARSVAAPSLTGAFIVALFGGVGALSALALTRPQPGGWALGALGVLLISAEVLWITARVAGAHLKAVRSR
jgi:hypothetical protein